jgi:hypothetical protein
MYRLGTAELNGSVGLSKKPKEGVKWLKRSAEHATEEYPHALHELALLHERGIDNILFVDNDYAAELLAQAAELGYAPSAFKLGECYEYGKMGCPQDAALSIHYYVGPGTPIGARGQSADSTLCRARTLPLSKATGTHVSLSQRGISSAHRASFRSPTPRRICGLKRPPRWASPKPSTPWDTSQRCVPDPSTDLSSAINSRNCVLIA